MESPSGGLWGRFSALRGLGRGLLGAAIAVYLFINLMVIFMRAGQASPERMAALVTPLPATQVLVAAAEGSPVPNGTPIPATATVVLRPSATAAPVATPTSTSTPTFTPTPTPFPASAQKPIAPVEGSIPYLSSNLPYGMLYSAAWSVQPGLPAGRLGTLNPTDFRGDTFLQLAPQGASRASLLVVGEKLPNTDVKFTPDLYLEALKKAAPDVWLPARQLQRYAAGVSPAIVMIMDTPVQGGQRMPQIRAVFTTGATGWQMILTTTPQKLAADTGLLIWMLDRFESR